ncbi:MAG: ComEC/Rec2 family competence protein, partial [Candidatus Omnitrophica bacterium]|nr:ComEC/Rec2 family competence protein [Candidatus Omnitrophota bacterium]
LFLGIFLLWFLRERRCFLALFVFLLGCSGILWARLDAYVPPNAVQNFTSPERVTLRGVVDFLPEMKTRGKKSTVSLVLKARSITRQEGSRRKFHKVSGDVQVFLLQSPVLPQVGDELRLYGELSALRTALNPGEFDYGNFLAQKNIHAVFQTIGKKCVRVSRVGNSWAPARILANTRRRLAVLVDKLYRPEEASIVKALVLGLRSDVSSEVRNQFMKTGTIHLLAISGMNITMIAGTFYLIFLFCGLGFRGASCVTILIVIVYVGLAGTGIPIQRAGYGAVLVLFAALAGRPAHLLNALCFSFFVILVCNPQSLWNIGFQLSFLCVFSLILIFPLLARVSAWTLSLGSSLAVLFGTFPVVLYYFNIFSPVSILANIVAISLCDAALFTALFALLLHGVPVFNIVFVKISTWIITGSLAWVKYLSSWSWGYWFLERPSLGLLVAYYASISMILFCYKKAFQGKRFLMVGFIGCWIIFSVSFFTGSGGNRFELTLLASGRNQIVHARFSNEAHWLLNTGRNFPSDQGEWLIAPFLRNRGVQRLDGILLSDLSKTNTGGLASVLRDFPVRYLLYPAASLYGPDEFYKNLRKLGRKAKTFQQGDEVLMGEEKIRMIALLQKSSAFLMESGPWRILLISKWDPELFKELLRNYDDSVEIHAVFLPASGQGIPGEFQDWFDRVRPLLVVLPDLQQELESFFVSRHVQHLDLKHTGALSFRRNGSRLELVSFLKGPLDFYSYS